MHQNPDHIHLFIASQSKPRHSCEAVHALRSWLLASIPRMQSSTRRSEDLEAPLAGLGCCFCCWSSNFRYLQRSGGLWKKFCRFDWWTEFSGSTSNRWRSFHSSTICSRKVKAITYCDGRHGGWLEVQGWCDSGSRHPSAGGLGLRHAAWGWGGFRCKVRWEVPSATEVFWVISAKIWWKISCMTCEPVFTLYDKICGLAIA